jgi:hypothetical protein
MVRVPPCQNKRLQHLELLRSWNSSCGALESITSQGSHFCVDFHFAGELDLRSDILVPSFEAEAHGPHNENDLS